ncbi:MAG: right-handed parallel beta-helix repeat-containing protein [Planctomycetota bacterium]|jgi:hypothetical protein
MNAPLASTCVALLLLGAMAPSAEPPLPEPAQPEPAQEVSRVPRSLALGQVRPTVYIDRLPWRISRPGRYELHGSLQMAEDPSPNEATGILISSGDVVLDLGGHALIGVKGSATGILVKIPEKRTAQMLNITVRNGSVRNWGGNGVNLQSAVQARVEDLQLAGNGEARQPYDGLVVGDGAIVSRVSAQYNASAGIRAGAGSQLVACTGSNNGGSGLLLGAGGLARECVATRNNGDGLVLSGAGGTAIDCTASRNGRHGISTGPAARVSGCTAWSNSASGIRVEGHGLVQDCLASSNGDAGVLALSSGTRIDANHLSANGTGLDVAGRDHLVVRNSLSGNTVGWSVPSGNLSGGLHKGMTVEQFVQMMTERPDGALANEDLTELFLRDPWANVSH